MHHTQCQLLFKVCVPFRQKSILNLKTLSSKEFIKLVDIAFCIYWKYQTIDIDIIDKNNILLHVVCSHKWFIVNGRKDKRDQFFRIGFLIHDDILPFNFASNATTLWPFCEVRLLKMLPKTWTKFRLFTDQL